MISFAGGLPAPELFDVAGLREAFATVLSGAAAGRVLQYSTTEGDPALCAAIAERLTARGVGTSPEELLITSGSQQALTFVATVLLEPGDRVLVEEASYLAALQCFALSRAIAITVPYDDDGLAPDALAGLAAAHRPKLLYTIPTFQNPTGRTMPLVRRRALVEAAERTGLWIAEDDAYGELRYDGRALPPPHLVPAGKAAHHRPLHAVQDRLSRSTARLGARPPDIARPADDRQTGRRPALLDDRPGGHRPLADQHRPRRAHRPPSGRLSRAPRRAARRPRRRAPGALDPQPPARRHVRVGTTTRRVGRNHATPAGSRARHAYVPGAPFFSAQPDRATLRLSFTAHPPQEIHRGLTRLQTALAAS